MKTKYIDMRDNINEKNIKEAAICINRGGLVLFPTETVYGIGANAFDDRAIEKIYKAKKRASDNPLILHISDIKMLNQIAENITELEKKLIDNFFPGPFTIILNKNKCVSYKVTAGLDSVAVRMPSNIIAHKLIEYSKVPIAAPSANISGRPSGTKISDIFAELNGKINYIIDSGDSDIGIESTVVRVINDTVKILRPGKITVEDILKVTTNVEIDKHVLNKVTKDEKVISPGIKYRHYAPKTKCILVYSNDNNKMCEKIKKMAILYNKALVVSVAENIEKYNDCNNIQTIEVGHKNNLEEISKNMFSVLRKVDDLSPDIVFIEGVEEKELGLAIMNRLIRTCEYNYIKV